MREDGVFIEAGENDNLIVQKLDANPNAFGIFGFANVEENAAKIKATAIDGVVPTFETIASGEYAVARPLFVYAKKQHVGTIPGMAEFVAEFMSEKAIGEEGYLGEKGLIPLPAEEAAKVMSAVKDMVPLTPDLVN
jgi:phosphate transport system substrate-binding protein